MRTAPVGVVVAAILVAMGVVAGPAAAGPRSPEPVEVVETAPAGEFCEFPIDIRVSGKAKSIDLPGGRSLSTSPGLDAVVTNLDAPENSVSSTITGAFHVADTGDGGQKIVATGRNLLFDPEAGFVFAVGRFSFAFDSTGNLVQPLSGTGRLIDICALIA